ncbi:lactate racemase domain-containing protein [Tundrisphaera sp. TA3]|uniref:lactate racemase domain-containing protein n=1 Tax=Tundrisphaera sp. TA3 TaxID=3435775 RepID=UPI003EB71CE5
MYEAIEGAADAEISDEQLAGWIDAVLGRLREKGPLRRVLLIPPDFTRSHSGAGPITVRLWERLRDEAEVAILPALGTHFPMEAGEREEMFPGIPASLFHDHDWRNGVADLGDVPASVMAELSEGKVRLPAKVQVDRLLLDTKWDAILSIGQLVPHEVIGIANHVKNVLVGAGGHDLIHKSHWLGAVYGMERIMGRARSPVRDLLNWAADHFLADLPLVYLLTVRGLTPDHRLVTRGLFAGDDPTCYERGAELCRASNLDILDHAPKKVVVKLDAQEFKSTWLGNKAVYRTRMAIADDGELVILAPGVRHFGEDAAIDALIRRFGYRGTPETLASVIEHPDLGANLSAAAHLIHGSSEGRFRITYCPGHMSRAEVEGAGYSYADLAEMTEHYQPAGLTPGWNHRHGEELFYVPNPALGLWGTAERFAG